MNRLTIITAFDDGSIDATICPKRGWADYWVDVCLAVDAGLVEEAHVVVGEVYRLRRKDR